MPSYERMYFRLFNTLTDVLVALEKGDIFTAMALIKKAQCDAEDIYIKDL